MSLIWVYMCPLQTNTFQCGFSHVFFSHAFFSHATMRLSSIKCLGLGFLMVWGLGFWSRSSFAVFLGGVLVQVSERSFGRFVKLRTQVLDTSSSFFVCYAPPKLS